MGQLGEILSFGFRERMDGVDRAVRRPNLKERLGLNFRGLGCCGAAWGLRPAAMSADDDDSDDEGGPFSPPIVDPGPAQSAAGGGMNLAAALAAERQMRAAMDSERGGGSFGIGASPPGTPARVSLMRLLEESSTEKLGEVEVGDGGGWVCCVCMGRKKGAAFIPCGHTFCRVCSREMWLHRGSCPLCNRPILEILQIY